MKCVSNFNIKLHTLLWGGHGPRMGRSAIEEEEEYYASLACLH
jgi:hypothetical protein